MSFFGIVRFVGCIVIVVADYFATRFTVHHLAEDHQDRQLIVLWSVAGAIVAFGFAIFALGGPEAIHQWFEARPETPYGGAEMPGTTGLCLACILVGMFTAAMFGGLCHQALLYREGE